MESSHLCSDLAAVEVISSRGRKRRITVNIEEISATGAVLQLERPLSAGTRLRLECSGCKGGCDRRGSVEDCRLRKGIGYDCRIAFEDGCQWDPAQCRPAHLLDPRQLEETARAACEGNLCRNRRVCPREVIARLIAPDVMLSHRARRVGREVASLCGELDNASLGTCFTGLFRAEPGCRLFTEFRAAYRARRASLRTSGAAQGNPAARSRRVARLLDSIPPEALGPVICSSASPA